MKRAKFKPILLIDRHPRLKMLDQYASVYPKNLRELYVVYPVETIDGHRYVELREWYPATDYRKIHGYKAGKQGIQIITKEALIVLIRALISLQDFIEKPKNLGPFSFPPHPIPFDTADNVLRASTFLKAVGEHGEHLPELKNLLISESMGTVNKSEPLLSQNT